MTTVTFEHVTKTYDQMVGTSVQRATVLDDISIKVHNGEVLGVVGPSGSGKSTLLRIAAGIIAPDKGEILFDNQRIDEIPAIERGIGMVFQDGALMPHWEARKSVGFHLSLKKREAEVPARVARISQITGIGLEQLLDRMPRQLSGGERQRVGVARALARDPKLFLFDEPFSNIDAKLRAQARLELRRLLNEFPVTSIYVTHDQHEAIALSDRILVLDEGRVVQIGTFQQLYDSPVNQFVAQFIGSPPINILEGRVEGGRWVGKTFRGCEVRHDLPEGAAVNLGVRVEGVKVVLDESGENAIVTSVIPHLAERYLYVEVEGNHEAWALTLPLEQDVRRGDVLRCVLDENALYFFDGKTGQRIM